MKPIDAIIRVSRVGGREGDSFISPEVQEKQIRAYLEAHNLPLGEVYTELDVSGGKVTDRASLKAIIGRIEDGESGGFIVAKLDRFARNTREALEVIDRIHEAGGSFICVEQRFDTTTPIGRVILTILLAFAQLERDTRKAGFEVAKQEAVNRGVHISAYSPVGYMRVGQGQPLALDPLAWEHVQTAGRMRIGGASWANVTDYLNERGITSGRGAQWIPSAVARMIVNPVYTGQARSGDYVTEDAHPAIFTREEHAALTHNRQARATTGTSPSATAVLRGFAVCATCGGNLIVRSRTVRKGVYGKPNYSCMKRRTHGTCEQGASVAVHLLDEIVDKALLNLMEEDAILFQELDAQEKLDEAQRALSSARFDLDTFLANTALLSILGEAKYTETAQGFQMAVELAEMAVEVAMADTAKTGLNHSLLESWRAGNCTVEERRMIAATLLGKVVVKPGGWWVPLEERVQIIRKNNVLVPIS